MRREEVITKRGFNMMEKEPVQAKGLTTRLLLVSIVSMFALSACIAAVPLAVKLVKEKDMAKLTMEVEGKAEEIYDASIRSTRKRNPDMEVIVDDREDLEFEVKKMTPEGKLLWASWKVEQKDEKTVEVEFKVKGEDVEAEVMEQRAMKGIQAFCAEIRKKCKIEE
jgi:hypothetical protein